jgi:release factor glutamine methyltransferase
LLRELAVTTGARHEARFIVEEVLGPTPSSRSQQHPVDPAAVEATTTLARRRQAGEPLQYLLGHWAFRSLDLMVDPRVLIPRPETEQVVEVALREIRRLATPNPAIVDAGTGSGAIALALATELAGECPGGRLWAVDVSADALAVAAVNRQRVERAHHRVLPVVMVEGRWLDPVPAELKGRIQLVVSNPPYVAEDEWDGLPADVQLEPRRALVAGPGSDGTPGLAEVESVLRQAWLWLARPGSVVIELAPHQAASATRLAEAIGFRDVGVAPDLAGRPRALVGRAG